MRFKVLGPLEVEDDDGAVPIAGQRLRALLTALLMQPNDVVPVQRLVDALWGEDPPDAPGNALQQVVTRLRGRLGRAAGCLVTAPGGYRVVVASDALDAEVFEAGYRRVRLLMDAQPATAVSDLESLLAMWRGPAYGEFASGFAQAASVRLEELRTSAAEDHVEVLVRTGAVGDAVAAARELVGSAPLRERPVELLMRALHASGRVAEALAAYREHRQLLAEELGLDPPVGLRELEARILQDDLPAPARQQLYRGPAVPTPRTGLPGRPGQIIGREGDLAMVRRCLTDQPLVSLVGPGGVGKTRLATEVAHAVASDGGTVVWVDLSALEPGRLVDSIADATGVEMPRGADPHVALALSLRASPALLVLDNAETVLGEVAPLVEALLDGATRLHVLVTSRERLAVHTEHVHRLAPLPLPSGADADNPAVRLFLSRASGLTDHLTEADYEDIALLCRRLDGLPLAIELGAAQAPTFGIREFAEHIAGELDLLAGGRRTAAPRHRTLRAVVDASYGLLTPDEAALFARLAVFPGQFTLSEVREICADEQISAREVGLLLARLADQSMVQAGGGRFWLLGTLRTYAREHIADRDLLRLRARHARFVADRVHALEWQQHPEAEASAVAQLAAMSGDLHAAWAYGVEHDRAIAVELAAAIYDFAYVRQRLDLMDWGRQVADWEIDHPDLSQALATGATAAWAAGDLETAEQLALRGIGHDEARQSRRARSLSQAGNLAMFAGRFDEAVDRFREAAEQCLVESRPVSSLVAEVAACQAMAYGGRAAEARERLRSLLERARATGNPSAIAWASYVTGEATGDTDMPTALAAYRAAVEESAKVDNRLFLGLARSSAVGLTARRGSPHDALIEFERLLDEWDDLGNVTVQWWVLMNLATLFGRLGQDRAAALLAGALSKADRTYMLLGDEQRLRETTEMLTERLGADVMRETLAEGRTLPTDQAVALARRTMRAAAQAAGSTSHEQPA